MVFSAIGLILRFVMVYLTFVLKPTSYTQNFFLLLHYYQWKLSSHNQNIVLYSDNKLKSPSHTLYTNWIHHTQNIVSYFNYKLKSPPYTLYMNWNHRLIRRILSYTLYSNWNHHLLLLRIMTYYASYQLRPSYTSTTYLNHSFIFRILSYNPTINLINRLKLVWTQLKSLSYIQNTSANNSPTFKWN